MDIWSTLEIEPTDDLSRIKKAYAGKLRTCRPDEDPEGYQHLKQAFEAAKAYARGESIDDEDSTSEAEEVDPLLSTIEVEALLSRPDDCADLIQTLTALDPNAPARVHLETWQQVLQDERLWQAETRHQFEEHVFLFLVYHAEHPTAVWQYIDTTFHWRHKELDLLERYPAEQVNIVLERLRQHSDTAAPATHTAPQNDVDMAANLAKVMFGIAVVFVALASLRLPPMISLPLISFMLWLWWQHFR